MKLELIHCAPEEQMHDTPILLVHGAWHGAWCWDDGFMQYLANRGRDVYAMSLRGHGSSEGREGLRWHSMADYASDVAKVVKALPKPPILVGHSMGGGVVQKYLEDHEVPGAVLLASLPVSGTWRFILKLIRRYPLRFLRFNLTMSAWPVVETPALTREWFYSNSVPEERIVQHFERLQDESFRAALDMMGMSLPRPGKVKSPVLVLAAENDEIFPVMQEQATARAYGTEAVIFPGMAHSMMSEPGWQHVADHILAWAEEQDAGR